MKNFIATLALLLMLLPCPARADAPPRTADQVRTEMQDAIEKVAKIVNQPVTHLKRDYTPGMVSEFSPGWFHPGANTPDFNNADVRKTQELPYAQHPYVSSDLNPTEMFIGQQLEFNSQLKYFYTDRTLPKKRLTEAEMVEINRLYRIIGHDQQELEDLKNGGGPGPGLASGFGSMTRSPLAYLPFVAMIGIAFFILSRKKKT